MTAPTISKEAKMDESLTEILNNIEGLSRRESSLPSQFQNLNFNLEGLMKADSDLCRSAQGALKILEKLNRTRITEGDVTVSGSCAEGCMLARWFLDKPKNLPLGEQSVESLESLMLHRPNEKPVSAEDILLKFLSSPIGQHEAKDHPDRMGNFKKVAGPILNILSDWSGEPPAASQSTSAQDVGVTQNAGIPGKLPFDPWEIEVDVLFNIGTITKNCERFFEQVKGKPAHVMLPYCDEIKACVKQRIWTKLQKEAEEGLDLSIDTDGYFDSSKIKRAIGILCIFRDEKQHLPLILGRVFHVPEKNIVSSVCSETTKTSHQFTINAKITDHISFNLASDLVGCFRVDFWPSVANEWITRNSRRWPDQREIDKIVRVGSQLVPRASDEGNQFKEFRWSFSHAEITLAKLMSLQQRRCYFVLKMMFYRYLKPLHKDLCSYMMKTTMLWVCEQNPPDHKLWTPRYLIATVMHIFGKLKDYFGQHYLPMFFMPQTNLLEGKIAPESCEIIADKISKILPFLYQLIPFDVPLVISAAKNQAIAVSRLLRIAEATTDNTIQTFIEEVLRPSGKYTQPSLYYYEQAFQEEFTIYLAYKTIRNKRKHMSIPDDDDLD